MIVVKMSLLPPMLGEPVTANVIQDVPGNKIMTDSFSKSHNDIVRPTSLPHFLLVLVARRIIETTVSNHDLR